MSFFLVRTKMSVFYNTRKYGYNMFALSNSGGLARR